MTTTANDTPGNILLTREYDAPRALVFKAWTDPQHLAQWWGPNGFTSPRCEWDSRPGGKIHVDMQGPNGTIYPMGGEVCEVAEPERLVFKCGALGDDGKLLFEILNTVTFAENEGRTTITLRTELLNTTEKAQHYLKGQKAGWSQSLNRFAAHMHEQPGIAPEREILITRVHEAARELVWDAMTKPEHVVKWWGPIGFTTTVEEMDVRPGGVWKLTMHGPDGTNYPSKSIFKEVKPPERLVFTLAGCKEGEPEVSFTMTWTFDALDENLTRTTIRQTYPTVEMREKVAVEFGAIEGGEQTLTRLAEELAAAPLIIERTVDAPVDLVWKAISEHDQMKEWYFDMEGFKAEIGCEFRFVVSHQGHDYDHRCKMLEIIPGRKLVYSWRYAGDPGDSIVTWELSPAAENKTRVKLTHAGLETFPGKPEYARKNFSGGWTMIVGSDLPDFLAKSFS